MVPVVWAQALGEYGVMAAIVAKFTSMYTQIELSLRTDPELWVMGGIAFLGGVWLLKRA
jgi:hypothetical protein